MKPDAKGSDKPRPLIVASNQISSISEIEEEPEEAASDYDDDNSHASPTQSMIKKPEQKVWDLSKGIMHTTLFLKSELQRANGISMVQSTNNK